MYESAWKLRIYYREGVQGIRFLSNWQPSFIEYYKRGKVLLTPVSLTSLSGRSAGEGYKEFKEFGRMERALVMNVYHSAHLQLKTENIDISRFAIIIVKDYLWRQYEYRL